ncbi:hypothetical protein [Alicyclobacillus suci]|uniref:hypothetical protein n=1 Tax=Alicyclobacillus suci TaxID=2816080 RepID=UPI001A8F4AAE|nr:hypothetical protein [Alicyclobacillus suci]
MRQIVENPVFVTPHALSRFRERLDPTWDDDMIISWAQHVCSRLPDDVDWRDEALLYAVQFAGQHATVVVGHGEKEWKSVITVIGDQERLSRLMSWHGRRWCNKDSHRLRILRRFGYSPEECAQVMRKPVEDITKRWS